MPAAMRHRMLSLISRCSCITNVTVELFRIDKCICSTRSKWDRTCGRGHVYHEFAHAPVFRLQIPHHHAHCSCEWTSSLMTLHDPTHLHLMWIWENRRAGQNPSFALCATHSFIRLTSWDVVLTRNGLKTFKSSTYCLFVRLKTMF